MIWKLGSSMPATQDSNSAVSRKTENACALSVSSSTPESDLEELRCAQRCDVDVHSFNKCLLCTCYVCCILGRGQWMKRTVAPSFIQLTSYLRRQAAIEKGIHKLRVYHQSAMEESEARERVSRLEPWAARIDFDNPGPWTGINGLEKNYLAGFYQPYKCRYSLHLPQCLVLEVF